MRVDFRDSASAKPAGVLIRRDTGERLQNVFLFDTTTGEYGVWVPGIPGPVQVFGNAPLLFIKEKADGD